MKNTVNNTCYNSDDDFGFVCNQCGSHFNNKDVKYCPECGRKVISKAVWDKLYEEDIAEEPDWMTIYDRLYAEDESLLNDYVKDMLRRISWKLFENQDKTVENSNETENGVPCTKPGVIGLIAHYAEEEFSWLRNYIIFHILFGYARGNIDFDPETEDEIKWELGDTYDDWRAAVDSYVREDYEKNLGVDRAKEYFKRIGRYNRYYG